MFITYWFLCPNVKGVRNHISSGCCILSSCIVDVRVTSNFMKILFYQLRKYLEGLQIFIFCLLDSSKSITYIWVNPLINQTSNAVYQQIQLVFFIGSKVHCVFLISILASIRGFACVLLGPKVAQIISLLNVIKISSAVTTWLSKNIQTFAFIV